METCVGCYHGFASTSPSPTIAPPFHLTSSCSQPGWGAMEGCQVQWPTLHCMGVLKSKATKGGKRRYIYDDLRPCKYMSASSVAV